jgi:phosphoribosylaminoimidazole-succinocarboxamide synthase
VVRRYAVGSYLKRHPELKTGGDVPHRFETPLVEFFVKTTKGTLRGRDGTLLIEGLDPLKGEEDPLVADSHADTWELHLSKLPVGPDTKLREVHKNDILPSVDAADSIAQMATDAFTTIESFFARHDFKLIDFKIECGITQDGRIVIADVIDNDSWRLRDVEWRDVSKQSFRDGEDIGTIEDKYALVAKLMETE